MNEKFERFIRLNIIIKQWRNYIINPGAIDNHERYLYIVTEKYILDELKEHEINYKFHETKDQIIIDLFKIF